MPETTVALLQALIQNECVNNGDPDSGFEFRSVATLQQYFGLEGRVFEPHPGRKSLLYRIPGRRPEAPRLMMMGHLDVVPVSPEGWTRPPFGGVIEDGFVWGRGAVDMLNVTAAMAVVAKRLLTGELPQPTGDILFLAVADEEAGGTYGAEWIIDHHWEEVACEFLLTEIAYPALATTDGMAAVINVGEKGPHWQMAYSEGVPGHASQPFATDNALVPMARAIAALAEADTPVIISDEWLAFVGVLDLPDELREALTDPDMVDEAVGTLAEKDEGFARYAHACTHMTVTPTILTSGTKANVIPDRAEAAFDIRTLPGQDETTVADHLAKVLGDDIERIRFVPQRSQTATSSKVGTELWEALIDAYEVHTGSRLVVPAITPAATDARFFRNRGVIAYGAGWFDDRMGFTDFLSMFHGHDERVSVASVEQTTAFLETVVERFSDRVS